MGGWGWRWDTFISILLAYTGRLASCYIITLLLSKRINEHISHLFLILYSKATFYVFLFQWHRSSWWFILCGTAHTWLVVGVGVLLKLCHFFSVFRSLVLTIEGDRHFWEAVKIWGPFPKKLVRPHVHRHFCTPFHGVKAYLASVTGMWAVPTWSRELAWKVAEPACGRPLLSWWGAWEWDLPYLAVRKCVEKSWLLFSKFRYFHGKLSVRIFIFPCKLLKLSK